MSTLEALSDAAAELLDKPLHSAEASTSALTLDRMRSSSFSSNAVENPASPSHLTATPTTPDTELENASLSSAAFGCNLCQNVAYWTVAELKHHLREKHRGEDTAKKLFRCALPGCSRVYKNPNGITYHVSAASQGNHETLKRRGRPSKLEEPDKIPCPVTGCPAVYRQVSGLRYHLVRHDPPISIHEIDKLVPDLGKRLKGRGDAFNKAIKDIDPRNRRRKK